jgi:tetratricopeptide (TPR) repeat protein
MNKENKQALTRRKAMIATRIVAAIVLAGFAAGAAVPQADYSLIQKYKVLETTVSKAQKDLDQGRLDRCAAEIAKCVETVPDHHEAHYLRAQILYKQADYAAAFEAMGKAKSGYRRLVELLEKFKAEKVLKQMDDAQALADLAPALDAYRNTTVCRQSVANEMFMENDKELNETKRQTQGDLSRKEDAVPADYDYFAGNCLFKLKRYDEAAASYKEAIAADPSHANSYTNLVNLLYAAKRFDEARDFIDRAEAAGVKVHPGLKKAVLARY